VFKKGRMLFGNYSAAGAAGEVKVSLLKLFHTRTSAKRVRRSSTIMTIVA